MTEPTERIARFGPGGHLLGIVTTPAQAHPEAPACLLFNAGVVHRIGPHRLNVKLARALAARGLVSIRMDLSGLGDSSISADAAPSSEQALADLQAAMAHLEATEGIRRFAVFGLCSGARHGYRLALVDERIVGVLMYDGYVFPTFRTKLERRRARFRTLPWEALLRKPGQWLSRKSTAKPPSAVELEPVEPMHPTRAQFAAAMDTLVDRGTAVYTVHSGSFIEAYNYADQWRDGFRGARFLAHTRHDYLPDIDHTLTTVAAQRKLIASIGDWVQGLAAGNTGNSR